MITLISLLIMLLFIKIMFRILPAIIGFSFTVILTLLQILGFLLLVPVIGVLFIFVDLVFIGIVVGLVKIIV